MNQKCFVDNRKKVLDRIENDGMVLFFSGNAPRKSADEYYPFSVNRNFYYLTGIEEEGVMLILTKQKDEQKAILFIKEQDEIEAKWVGKTIDKEEAERISGITDIRYVSSFGKAIHRKIYGLGVTDVYFDLERESFDEDLSKAQRYAHLCREKYPHIVIKNSYPLLAQCRMKKTVEEVADIKTAIAVTYEGIKSCMTHAESGMMEYELEAYFDFELKKQGIKDFAFKTIAASEKNATILHYKDNNSQIPKNSLILFDLGAQYNYYNADITRTFPVDGIFTERQKCFYNIVLKAQLEVISAIRPGVSLQSLNERVKEIYFEELQALGMVKEIGEVSKYYYHGVSHHLGLDTHDISIAGTVLEEGMVITVEPGLYIEDEAIGIRIEDDVWVTKEGCEVLSSEIIKTVEEIEAFMAK